MSKHFSKEKFQELCKPKFNLREIYNKKVEYALHRLKSFYEAGEKTGKLLARQLKEKTFANTIPFIKKEDRQLFSVKDINRVFQQYCEKLYTSSIPSYISQEDIEQFLLNIEVPKLQPQDAAELESPITEAETRKAVT